MNEAPDNPVPREAWFSLEEYRARLARVRKAMAERDLDALLVFSPANFYYLTGHHSIDTWEFRVAIVTPGRDPVVLLYGFERGRFLASSWLNEAIFFGPGEKPPACLTRVLAGMGLAGSRLGVESSASNVTVATWRAIATALPDAELVETDRLVDRVRCVKSPAEVACVRRAAEITMAGMRAAGGATRVGAADREIVAAATGAMFAAGSHQFVMQPTVAVGYRSGLSHSQHDGAVVRGGDAVFVELSGNHRHYSAPLMDARVVGGPNDEQRRLIDAAHAVAARIIETVRPGVRACDVAAAAHEILRPVERLIQFHYVWGYSVGISYPPHWLEESMFHLTATNDAPLEAGMVFHLPLTLRVLGRYGAGTSRTILVTGSGCDVLTRPVN